MRYRQKWKKKEKMQESQARNGLQVQEEPGQKASDSICPQEVGSDVGDRETKGATPGTPASRRVTDLRWAARFVPGHETSGVDLKDSTTLFLSYVSTRDEVHARYEFHGQDEALRTASEDPIYGKKGEKIHETMAENTFLFHKKND